jgi:hypothetical protein
LEGLLGWANPLGGGGALGAALSRPWVWRRGGMGEGEAAESQFPDLFRRPGRSALSWEWGPVNSWPRWQ